MRVVKPSRGNSLLRVHHCNNSLFPARGRRLACPTRKAVTRMVARLKREARARAQGRAAQTASPRPCKAATRSESATTVTWPSADRRSFPSAPRHDYAAPLSHEPSRRSARRTAPAGRRGPGDENTGRLSKPDSSGRICISKATSQP